MLWSFHFPVLRSICAGRDMACGQDCSGVQTYLMRIADKHAASRRFTSHPKQCSWPVPTRTFKGAMIKFVLMVNKMGQTRVSSYYDWMPIPERVALEAEVVRRCFSRSELQCSFFEFRGYKIIYRRVSCVSDFQDLATAAAVDGNVVVRIVFSLKIIPAGISVSTYSLWLWFP